MLYDADGILLKSVSNKRWVKKVLNETQTSFLNRLNPIILKYCNLGSIYGISTKNVIGLAIIGNALTLPASTKNLELEMRNMCGQETSMTFFGNKIINCGETYTKKDIIVFAPVLFLDLDVKSGNYENHNIILFNAVNSESEISNAEQLLSDYLTKNNYIFWGDSLNYINKNFPSLIDNLQRFSKENDNENYKENNYEETDDLEINEIKIKQKENVKPDISDDIKAKSKIIWDVKVAGKNQLKYSNLKNAVIPEIKTRLVVNDEKFRTLDNVCSMVMNNITKIKNGLKIFNYDKNTLKKLFYSDEDLDQYDFFNKQWSEKELEEQNSKYPEAVKFFSKKEQQMIQARVCYVYYRMMQLAKDGIFNEDIEFSRGLNYCLHNYLIELTSPMVIIKNAITWNKLNGKQGDKVLAEVIGLQESQWEQNSYIMYPLSSTYPLADSILNMNGKILKVSTKGGLDGKGAFATLKSLREYVFEGENGSGNITEFGKNIKNQYPDLFNIFDILTNKEWGKDITKYEWDEMYNNISNKIGKKNIDIHKQIQEYINKDVNTSWTKMIMKILESASYDFIQVNAKASDTAGDFHFNYTAQYPAVFNGKVKLDLKDTGKATFHIEE